MSFAQPEAGGSVGVLEHLQEQVLSEDVLTCFGCNRKAEWRAVHPPLSCRIYLCDHCKNMAILYDATTSYTKTRCRKCKNEFLRTEIEYVKC